MPLSFHSLKGIVHLSMFYLRTSENPLVFNQAQHKCTCSRAFPTTNGSKDEAAGSGATPEDEGTGGNQRQRGAVDDVAVDDVEEEEEDSSKSAFRCVHLYNIFYIF